MVEALPNLQVVYAKWQSRNPYMRGDQPCARLPDGGGDSCPGGLKSWQATSGRSLCPPARRRAAKQRGRNRQENGLTNSDELMVGFSSSCFCTQCFSYFEF